MSYTDELSDMVDDCQEILSGDVRVVITVYTAGAFDPATGIRAQSGGEYIGVAALRSERRVAASMSGVAGGVPVMETVYSVSQGATGGVVTPGAKITDGTRVMYVWAVEDIVADLAQRLYCRTQKPSPR